MALNLRWVPIPLRATLAELVATLNRRMGEWARRLEELAAAAGGGGATGPAGGVLAGTYPNPGFAVDMATQAELTSAVNTETNARVAADALKADATDTRFPTAGEKSALAGTSGAPGAANKYVTDGDARNTNSRAPSGTAGGVLSGTYPNPGFAVDMATQAELDAVATTTPTAGEKAALAGTSGAPGSGNKYVTDADARNTNARTPTTHSHAWTDITSGKPTTVGGYGITDVAPMKGARLTADQAAIGTTLTTVAGLDLAIAAGEEWLVEYTVFFTLSTTTATAGCKVTYSGTAAAGSAWNVLGSNGVPGAGAATAKVAAQDGFAGSVANTVFGNHGTANLKGALTVDLYIKATTAGTLSFQMNGSAATSLTPKAGSAVVATRLA